MMKTIILYGMRGTGKSTVGRLLAEKLGYSFLDLDNVISEKNGQNLADYIEKVGWDEFRDEEHRCLKEVLKNCLPFSKGVPEGGGIKARDEEGRVISLGGGTIVFERNRDELFKDKNTKIIYLDTDLEEISKRILKDEKLGEKRNSLTGKTVLEELEEVYEERKEIYENNCDFSVDNNGEIEKTIAEIAYKLTWGGICVPLTHPLTPSLLRRGDTSFIMNLYEKIKYDRKIEYVELRLDLMFTKQVGTEYILSLQDNVLKSIIQKCPKKVICTLRHVNEGGKFAGTADEQIDILKQCIDYGADYIDIELQNFEKISKDSRSAIPTEKLILSYHDFQNTQDLLELKGILKSMKKLSPAVYKIACMPKTLQDIDQMYRLTEYFFQKISYGNQAPLVKEKNLREGKFVFISMGNLGLPTRSSLVRSGALLTFASYGENISAPGQIAYTELYNKIHSRQVLFGKGVDNYEYPTYENIEKSCKKYSDLDVRKDFIAEGIFSEKRVLFLGREQISGSLSPFMHNFSSSLLQNEEKKFFYMLARVENSYSNLAQKIVEEFVSFLESDNNFLGGNVTMPYKVDMYDYLCSPPLGKGIIGDFVLNEEAVSSRLDQNAQLVGAVNTLYKEGGKIFGTNTDIDGVKLPVLEKLVGTENILSLQQKISSCYILGAGGASRAAVAAMIELGVQNIYILNRSQENLDEIVAHFTKLLGENQKIITKIYDVANGDIFLETFEDKKSIIINTLPFGFKEHLPQSPINFTELAKILPNLALYFEAVYDSARGDTPIVKKIEEHNKNISSFSCKGKDAGKADRGIKSVGEVKICRGIEMLISQAKTGFELWSDGGEFQMEEIKKILLK